MNFSAIFTALSLSMAGVLFGQVAGPPAAIDYQGRLLDNNGDPIAPGAAENIEMYFRIWDHISDGTGANLIWAEKQIVTVLDGNFSVRLGEGTPVESSAGDNVIVAGSDDPYPPLPEAFDGSSRYLGMSVAPNSSTKPESEIAPRLAFLASPFSFVAERARYAEFGPAGGTFEAGSVGVGIDTPVSPLHVHGSSTFGDAVSAGANNASNIINILSGENESGASNGITFFQDATADSGMSFGFDSVGAGAPALRLYGFDSGALVSFGEDGDVGIGEGDPAAPLHISRPSGGVAAIYATAGGDGEGLFFAGQSDSAGGGFAARGSDNRIAFFRRAAGVDHEVFSYGQDTDDVHFAGRVGVGASPGGHKLHVDGNINSPNNIYIGDKIGIGTTAPKARLHIDSQIDSTLSDGTGVLMVGDEQDTNLVIDDNEIGARKDGAASLLHLNPHGGNVRIGGGTNQYGRLSVNGATTYDLGWAWLHGVGQSASNANRGNRDIAIGTDKTMRASGYFVKSDQRMKQVAGLSDSADDLQTLLGLEITDYTHVDVHSKGGGRVKKVIAQQVEAVYPEAVTKGAAVVPDIYQLAPWRDGWVELATEVQVGERVKLIAKGSEGLFEVLETRDGAFRTEFKPDAGGEVFVFGREVDDFRSVDYDALAMLNVSATQELYRRITAQSAELAANAKHISALEERLAAIERRLATGAYLTAAPVE